MVTSDDIGGKIRALERKRKVLFGDILELVRQNVPDYHFLDYEISTFWSCEKSPVGMCLFKLDDLGRKGNCRYCNGPVERK